MKKFYIIFSLAAFSIQVFAAGLEDFKPKGEYFNAAGQDVINLTYAVLEDFKPKGEYFDAARQDVINLTRAVLHTQKFGSVLSIVDPVGDNIVEVGDFKTVCKGIITLDIFYGHPKVVKEYTAGGSQVGMCQTDIEHFVCLVGLAKCIYGKDFICTPLVRALAQEILSRQQVSGTIYASVHAPDSAPQSLDRFYAERGQIPPHIGALSRPLPEMTREEMVVNGLPYPSEMASPVMVSTPKKPFPLEHDGFSLQ